MCHGSNILNLSSPFFFGSCEQGHSFSGLAKSRIWWAFLSFCALIIFKQFLLLFLFFGREHIILHGARYYGNKVVDRAEAKDKAYPCSYPAGVLSQ